MTCGHVATCRVECRGLSLAIRPRGYELRNFSLRLRASLFDAGSDAGPSVRVLRMAEQLRDLPGSYPGGKAAGEFALRRSYKYANKRAGHFRPTAIQRPRPLLTARA